MIDSPEPVHAFSALTLSLDDLLLRPFQAADVPGIVEACSDRLGVPTPYTAADARFHVETQHDFRESGDGIRCAVARSEDDVLVGSVGVKATDWGRGITDVGYWCRPGFRGHGYMIRATRALSLWALDQGMERIELRAAPANAASNAVAHGAGFTLEGVMRNAGVVAAGRVDLHLYSLVRADRPAAMNIPYGAGRVGRRRGFGPEHSR